MQLTALPFLLALVFNSATASLDTDSQSGFDCGRVFFGRNIIRNAGSLVAQNMMRSPQISLAEGDLMRRWGKPNHVGWPIRESGQIYGSSRCETHLSQSPKTIKTSVLTPVLARESFYILVDYSSGRVKDVMARLLNDDFTRCLRKSVRRKSPLLDTSNGYRCGQNFFGDEQLRDDVNEAISKLDQGLKYPSPYKGNLYTEHEYLTWPILNDKKDNTSSREKSPFHVILSRDGKIIDVVAKLMCHNFIKCERVTKSLRGRSTKTSQLQRRGPAVPINYICDSTVTFKSDYLEHSRLLAATKAPFNKIQPPMFPRTYTGAPCQGAPCKLWPIFPNGRNYADGAQTGKHFLRMNMDLSVTQGVLSQGPAGMVPCRGVAGNNQIPRPNTLGRIGGVPQTNHRGEFIARPGAQPPVFRPQGSRGQ